MFGTMGFSELIIILVIILIIFGAGRLPQIGEGVGKALRGFKKEVQDEPLPATDPAAQPAEATASAQPAQAAPPDPGAAPGPATPPKPTAPYTPGPELTPGTTAALMATAAPQAYQPPPKPAAVTISAPIQSGQQAGAPAQHVPTMEERVAQPAPARTASYPPLPPSAQSKPAAKRPSAIVNKDAVARVQAQQAAMRAKAAQGSGGGGLSPDDMGSFGQGLGEAFRMVRDVSAEVRGAIDPQVRTLRAEVDAASKEIEQSIEAAKELPAMHEEPPAKSV